MVTVTVSSKYQVVIPKEVRAWMKLKPGQKVRITEKDGVIHLVPIRRLRKSGKVSLPRLRPFVREGKPQSLSRLNQMMNTSPSRLGKPSNPTPSKMKGIWKTA